MRSAILTLTLICLFAVGCGGGDGGAAQNDAGAPATPRLVDSTDDVTGAYYHVSSHEIDGTTGMRTFAGLTLFDGLGVATNDLLANVEGAIQDVPLFNLAYDVFGGGSFVWSDAGTPFAHGGLSPDGTIGVAATTAVPQGATIFAMVKRPLTAPGDIGGAYYHMMWMRNQAADSHITRTGPATFDSGTGVITYGLAALNTNGVGSTATPAPANFTLAHDVSVLEGGELLIGGAAVGGRCILVGGGVTVNNRGVLSLYIRQSTAVSDATVAGEYHVVGLRRAGGFTAVQGVATLDGAGSGTKVAQRLANHIVTGPFTDTITYETASDGRIQMSIDGDTPIEGAVTDDGSLIALCSTAGTTTSITLFVRK